MSLSFEAAFVYQIFNYAILVALALVYLYEHIYSIDYKQIGWNYARVIYDRQVWRAYTSTVSHCNILFLALTEFFMWGCGGLELVLGTVSYIKFILLIFTLNELIFYPLARFVLSKYWPARFPPDERNRNYTLGWGSMTFGLSGLATMMAFGTSVDWECARCDQYIIVFGAFDVETPFANGLIFLAVSLAFIAVYHFVIPKVDTVACCTGLFTGLVCGCGAFIWFNKWCLLVLFGILVLIFTVSVWRYSNFKFSTHCFKPSQSFPQTAPSDSEQYSEEQNREMQHSDPNLPQSQSMAGPIPAFEPAIPPPASFAPAYVAPSAPPTAAAGAAAAGQSSGTSGGWFGSWFDRRQKSDPELLNDQSTYQPPAATNHRSAFDVDPFANANNISSQQQQSAWDP